MITFVCVLVRGHVNFSTLYVEKLLGMVRKHYHKPFQFVCLTDQPNAMPDGVDSIEIALPKGCKGWWAKVQLFNPAWQWSGRVVYLDLDTLVVAALDAIVNYPAKFALAPDGAPNFHGHGELKVIKRFNSSVMVWNGGENSRIYSHWTPMQALRLHGDQDWIGEQCPNAEAMPIEWFPRISEISSLPLPKKSKVVLCKKPKNVIAAQRFAWVKEAWG